MSAGPRRVHVLPDIMTNDRLLDVQEIKSV